MPDPVLKSMLLTPREEQIILNNRNFRGHEHEGLLCAHQVEGRIIVTPQGAMMVTENPMAMPQAFMPFASKKVRITIEEIPT